MVLNVQYSSLRDTRVICSAILGRIVLTSKSERNHAEMRLMRLSPEHSVSDTAQKTEGNVQSKSGTLLLGPYTKGDSLA